MPVRKTPLVTGEIYHIYNRGINKQNIFLHKRDYSYLLEIIEYYSYLSSVLSYSKFRKMARYKRELSLQKIRKDNKKMVDLLAFCIMPNHYHLIVRQVAGGGVCRYLRNVQNSYASYFNIKHKREGSLFQGRFKAVRILDDEQLIHVLRYVHLNPTTSYVVYPKDLVNYPWSSLSLYLNGASNPCETKTVMQHFSSSEDYTEHIMDQVDYQKQLKRLKDLVIE